MESSAQARSRRARAARNAFACGIPAAVLLWASAGVATKAHAELVVQLAGVGGWQYNSNVYDVQSGFPIPGSCIPVPFHPSILACPSDAFHYSDSYYSYGGQLSLNETYSQQN